MARFTPIKPVLAKLCQHPCGWRIMGRAPLQCCLCAYASSLAEMGVEHIPGFQTCTLCSKRAGSASDGYGDNGDAGHGAS
jgi:hypothetical protein